MYCGQCGKQIPDDSKFCKDCGYPISDSSLPSRSDISQEEIDKIYLQPIINSQEPSYASNDETTNAKTIPPPKLSKCISFGFMSIMFLVLAIFTIDIFFSFIISFLGFGFTLLGCILFTKDYVLAKKDFNKYQEKMREEQKAHENLKAAMKAEKEEWQKAKQKERRELNKKRAKYQAQGIPTCPKCASPSIATTNRGYSIVTGFIGSGKPINVCQNCGHKWEPGKF